MVTPKIPTAVTSDKCKLCGVDLINERSEELEAVEVVLCEEEAELEFLSEQSEELRNV